MKARTTLPRKGIRGELGNKSKMIQGNVEGTEVRGAFGGIAGNDLHLEHYSGRGFYL